MQTKKQNIKVEITNLDRIDDNSEMDVEGKLVSKVLMTKLRDINSKQELLHKQKKQGQMVKRGKLKFQIFSFHTKSESKKG